MSKSLADLRANPVQEVRPRRTQTVCLRPDLPAKVQALTNELTSLPMPPLRVDDEDREGAPRKAAKSDEELQADAKSAELQAAIEEMAEHEGEIVWEGIDDTLWRQWVSKNPPRAKGEPGYERDREVCRGYCNADRLIADLARYAYAWNGDPFADGEFEKLILPNMSGPDKKVAANSIVVMHEVNQDFRQWRSGLSDSLKRLNGSAPPEPSGPAPASSTDGSAPSSTSTSTPPATPPE